MLDCDHLACHCRVGPLVPAMVKQPQTVQPACTAQSLEHSRQGTVQGKRPLPKAPATPVRQAQLPTVPLASSRQATAEHRYVNRASRHAVHVMLHPLLQKCITSSGRAGVQHSREWLLPCLAMYPACSILVSRQHSGIWLGAVACVLSTCCFQSLCQDSVMFSCYDLDA